LPPSARGEYGPLSTEDGRTLEIERLRPGKGVVIVKFRGIDDRTNVERLNGISLFADRDALPPPQPDEFYHADLIGLTALSTEGAILGAVVAVHNFGAGDIVEIAPPRGPSLLVPFTKAAVPDIDIANGRMTVIPPPEADEDFDTADGKEDAT
jgi:16S rRNA processing protein RimM